ncbi:malate synthase G [Pseudoalteromonas aurantia]|uniref:Malate synthase G n=1 Tax=Pseudoalteromonas aurantia 208 TaxID=1314867 RepID=A0ABR9EGU3_9GAMM|nr:malate synthase G [Pseudoalteromonas aurantia]MBE0370186.1 malate synthase [Pseudoalteromonas aurantia 208]
MSMTTQQSGLTIDRQLFDFVNMQALPGTDIEQETFWSGFAKLIETLSPINKQLLFKRDKLQSQIDEYHKSNPVWNGDKYRTFLVDIGYLVPSPERVSIDTDSVDPEIASIAGPQLVVPVSNARFALNAANARWGSLYDALYGTDVLPQEEGAEKTQEYNPVRGFKVMAYARQFLDNTFPLRNGSHIESTHYAVLNGQLVVTLNDSKQVSLLDPQQFVGYQGEAQNPSSLLLKRNGLHVEIQIDPHHPIGQSDKAGISDLILESALTTIMDCEDSVAAVDAQDKVGVYTNWLGLMTGTLKEEFKKEDTVITRVLNKDKHFVMASGKILKLKGRSMMFVRNVGHLMTTPAILDQNGEQVFEGILDAVITSLCALHDLKGNSEYRNSISKSINIVKPKMHGPEEVAFTSRLFSAVEGLLYLPNNTIKMGIMDEERRTSVNLKACIEQAKSRVVFINTGFLDRTGDEIHTSMLAGPMLPKSRIKSQPWISAYEKGNVEVGLACGFSGKAQIGKGMWPMPDLMALMMKQKLAHPESGASTAWVPSPTAATLHAMHYHTIDVFQVQAAIGQYEEAALTDLLTPPLLGELVLTKEDIQAELDNNVQGILGYVVRWIDQGIGCSKVPDINHIGLMEDRATLRISSQHIANWLVHGICSPQQVKSTFAKMAKVVDGQNHHDASYICMADNEVKLNDNLAYQAALSLVFEGKNQPNGYTEPLLHSYRLKHKAFQ